MSAILVEFVGALLRWFHVIAGIAWVGASFYFIWVENSLNRRAEAQRGEEVAGHLWGDSRRRVLLFGKVPVGPFIAVAGPFALVQVGGLRDLAVRHGVDVFLFIISTPSRAVEGRLLAFRRSGDGIVVWLF